jgi:phosphoribosyl 1,2-cyclic phosphodiesterase
VKLVFLGTRGEIDATTERHRRHAVLLVVYRGRRVLVDCGADWRGRLALVRPHAIVLTPAHPDHVGGLADGATVPVHATRACLAAIARYPLASRVVIRERQPVEIEGIRFEAFAVDHSIRAPAVGYRITAGARSVFYVPDLVRIRRRHAALDGVDLYIGDGATVVRPIVRRRGAALIGHAPIRTQLEWCARERVPRALFSHCGSAIVAGDEAAAQRRVRELGQAAGVHASIAHDGLEVVLR